MATSSLGTFGRRREGRDGDHERVLEQTAVLGLPGGSGMAFGQTTHRYPPIIWRASERTVISNSPPFSARAYFLLLSYSSSSHPIAISMSPINPLISVLQSSYFPNRFPLVSCPPPSLPSQLVFCLVALKPQRGLGIQRFLRESEIGFLSTGIQAGGHQSANIFSSSLFVPSFNLTTRPLTKHTPNTHTPNTHTPNPALFM